MIINDHRFDNQEEMESFSLRNFLTLCLGFWKWFVLSVIVCVGIGLFYIYTRQPVFERSEEILIKDADSGGGIGDISNAFSSLGLFSSSPQVYNELISLTSPAVMFEVVERLNLTMNYNMRKGLKTRTLYGTSLPIVIEFPDLTDKDNVGLKIKIEPDGTYNILKMYNFTPAGKVKYKDEVSGVVDGSPVSSPLGTIVVKRNEYYIPNPTVDEDEIEMDVFKQSLQLSVEKYNSMLKGDLTDQDADVINLSIKDTSIERADDILNMVVAVYNERWIEDNNKMAVATSKFITDRLALIEKELGEVDNVIAQQKSEMKLPDIEEAAKGFMAEDFKMNEELRATSNMLAMTTYLKEYLQNPENAYNILPLNTGTDNPVLEQQISNYNQLLLALETLKENSSEQNPVVLDMKKKVDGTRMGILRSIDSHIANLKNAIDNINKAQNSTQKVLSGTPKQALALLSVERQQLVMQELYLFLLQKREENELSQAFTADNTRVITPPFGKQAPVSPKKGLLLIISIILGFGIPAGLLLMLEAMNTKIRSKKDIEQLPVPFAGEVPHIGGGKSLLSLFKSKKQKRKIIDKPRIVVSEGKRDVPNEAFRVIRSNLDFMIGKNSNAVIALTSFNPGSGKSFIAYNLGASFALKGKKVLIIDGDLRHGSISAYVHSPRKGLSTYLTGDAADWNNLVVESNDIKNLYVLPIGHRPPNPAELLDSGLLGQLIQQAKAEYDIVLIDCPPVNIVVDTQIINQYVSRTVFVVRAGLLEKKALKDLMSLVDDKKLKNITILLNGTKTEFSTYHTYGNYEAIDKL